MNIVEKIDFCLYEDGLIQVLNESGIRNIRELAKTHKNAEIYFHQDLDGVTSAIAIKTYLEGYGIKIIDTHMINYGGMEYSVPKPQDKTLHVLVDFAHGKDAIMHIHTDHHEGQVGVSDRTSTSFVHTPSNAAYLSTIIPKSDSFPQEDLKLISMVDSADFAKNDITPDDVMRAAFEVNSKIDVSKNRIFMGLVVNKLLLAYKNKKGFLDQLVLMAKPSLTNMYIIIKYLAKKNGYKTPEEVDSGMQNYIQNQEIRKKQGNLSDIINLKTGESMMFGNCVVQYGSSSLVSKTVVYDRYTVFKVNPTAQYLVMMWPLGLLQATVNPFIKGDNPYHLGELAQKVISKYKGDLKRIMVSADYIKMSFERGVTDNSMGFTMNDFMALFKKYTKGLQDTETYYDMLKTIMNTPFSQLSQKDHKILRTISVSAWDIIQAQSGGHKNITNLSGWGFIGKGFINIMKAVATDLVRELSNKELEMD